VQKNTALKGNVRPAGFPAGVKLAWEERKQEYDQTYYLLVAQLKLYSQFKHGINLVCAGLQANLLKVGICKAPCRALAWLTADGLERQLVLFKLAAAYGENVVLGNSHRACRDAP
jgi:hypothetical protein